MITLGEAVVLCSTFVCFPQRLTHLIVLCILSCFMSSWPSSGFLCSGFSSASTLLSLRVTIYKHGNSCLSSSFSLSATVVNRKGLGAPQHTSPVSCSAHACPGPLYHTSPQLSLTFSVHQLLQSLLASNHTAAHSCGLLPCQVFHCSFHLIPPHIILQHTSLSQISHLSVRSC